jgi:DNA-binding transcriptional MerR regulator
VNREQGFRAPQVCNLVGISYRQLDYWARTDLLKPSLQSAQGSGSQRLYSFADVVQLRVVKRLLDSDSPLADVTLLSDGHTIYAAHSDEEVVDLFRGGQGVFGIAVGPVQEELEGEILELFPDEAEDADGAGTATMEA